MEDCNLSNVEALHSEKRLSGAEACEFYWEKLCEYLLKTKHETVPIQLIDRIDERCSGFRSFAFDHAGMMEKRFMKAQMIMKKRRSLRRKYRKTIKNVVKSGRTSSEYEEYFRQNCALSRQLHQLRSSEEEKAWDFFLILPDETLVKLTF